MGTPSDYIHQLMTEKLAAVISAADEEYLDELIQNNPQVRKTWRALRQACMPAGEESLLKKLDRWPESASLLLTQKRISAKRTSAQFVRRYRKTGIAAALAAILVAAGWLLIRDTTGPDPALPDLVFLADNLDHIKLELAGGETVDLSRQQGRFRAGGAELNNGAEGLTFTPTTRHEGLNTLTVPAGATHRITLPDGTQVWMNSRTALKFPFEFNDTSREISIEGEAYIKVVKNTGQPFIVHLPRSDVVVTGTEFNVNTYDAEAEQVALVEGAVRLNAENATTHLDPGVQASYNRKSGWSKSNFDKEKVLAWRQGLFYFYNTTLEDIADMLPRWFGINVVIDDPRIRNKRFAGVLDRNEPLSVFLENMTAITNIHYYFQHNGRELHFSDAATE